MLAISGGGSLAKEFKPYYKNFPLKHITWRGLVYMKSTFTGSFLLGIGTVGMLDGIIFHQILQWHSIYMFTNRFYQIVSDGIFHLFVTVIIFIGAIILWRSDPSDSGNNKYTFLGGLFLGAGIFNFLEGIINHHILQIHHVKPGPNQFL